MSPGSVRGGGIVRIPLLSMVVPTVRRADRLERMLDSLLRQSVGPQAYEVIIVDNSATPEAATRSLCESKQKQGLPIRYAHQAIKGASAARNKGIELARSTYVACLDDDVLLGETWVERALAVQQERGPDVFGGPYIPYYTRPKPVWFKDEYETGSWGEEARWLAEREFLFGMNMVWRAALLRDLGGYPTHLGPGTASGEYGDETDLQYRATRAGTRLWYQPGLLVQHYVPPEKFSLRWQLSSRWDHGNAKALIISRDVCDGDRRPRSRIAASWLKSALGHALGIGLVLARLPVRDRKRYPFLENYLLERIGPRLSGLSMSYHTARILAQA